MTENNPDRPRQFGRFEVTDILGRGGMGMVYLARDPVIGRDVAIKVLRADPGLPPEERMGLLARFEQEFRSAGTLTHPNIVTIYDVGQQDEASFIAMEYVAGESLANLISSGRDLTFTEIADLATQIGSGLDYAHERGVVHRDVKPANILITPEGVPKITDFGVAKVVSATLTRTGTVVGTPAYMSPEQIVGQAVTGASDQFSLAIILYQVVTGELPFPGDNPTTILYKIVHEEPVGPNHLNPSLPPGLDRVLLRAMSKNPNERYPSCQAMGQAMSEGLGARTETPAFQETSQKTVTLQQTRLIPASGSYDGAGSWWDRQRSGPRFGIAALVLLLAMALGFIGWRGIPDLSTLFGESPVDAPREEPQISSPSPDPTPAVDLIVKSLEVTSNADGAAIWKDGVDTGQVTPATLQLEGRAGSIVTLELRRANAIVAQTRLTLAADMRSEWQATELSMTEVYEVTSTPPGARIFLGGEPTDLVTPAQLELTLGESYSLAVKLDGYEDRGYAFTFPDDLRAEERAARRLAFSLAVSIPPGFLVINAGYDVAVEVAGKRWPAQRQHEVSLPPGTYDVKLSAPNVFFEELRRGIVLESEDRRTLPVPRTGTAQVAAVPGNCRVHIDGRFVDESPFDQELTVGTHEFRFEWPSEGREKSVRKRIQPGVQKIIEALP